MKHPRLNGADLYVARLGWKAPSDEITPCCTNPDITDTQSLNVSSSSTGSLHEELKHVYPEEKGPISPAIPKNQRQPSVLSSRPCYRCVSYMNSVGIKRAFWTNDRGMWEGAKVRDLVDALDNLGVDGGPDGVLALKNVFVTKHEVLMLRRVMCSS